MADSIGAAAVEAHEGEVAAERCGVSVSAVTSEARCKVSVSAVSSVLSFRVVADNTLIQNRLKVLPVSVCG